MKYWMKFIACSNTPPASCDLAIVSCNNMFSREYCKEDWKDFRGCSNNQTGIVEDYCQQECKVCEMGILLYMY